MSERDYSYFFECADRLVKWIRRDAYCPIDLDSIYVYPKRGDYACQLVISSLIYDSWRDINDDLERYRSGQGHPNDLAFWEEATDWFEIGSVFEFVYGSTTGGDPYLYQSCTSMRNDANEIRRVMDDLERQCQERYPGVSFQFEKPETPSGGCYVATAVYGSYDCPPVWTLRRFRDERLAATWYGRVFIRAYYAISPMAVRWFGDTAWFNRFFRKHLDRLVQRLQSDGVTDKAYYDQ